MVHKDSSFQFEDVKNDRIIKFYVENVQQQFPNGFRVLNQQKAFKIF